MIIKKGSRIAVVDPDGIGETNATVVKAYSNGDADVRFGGVVWDLTHGIMHYRKGAVGYVGASRIKERKK